jgi:hypothetical protein
MDAPWSPDVAIRLKPHANCAILSCLRPYQKIPQVKIVWRKLSKHFSDQSLLQVQASLTRLTDIEMAQLRSL